MGKNNLKNNVVSENSIPVLKLNSNQVEVNDWIAPNGETLQFINVKSEINIQFEDGSIIPAMVTRKGKLMVKPEPKKVDPAKGRSAGTAPNGSGGKAASSGLEQDELKLLNFLKLAKAQGIL